MKSVYVAGSSLERDMVSRYMAGLRRAGFTIATDWPALEAATKVPEANLSDFVALDLAKGDLAGVRGCDIFWLLAPSTTSMGAWVELGYALGIKKPAIVISGSCPTIFARCASQRYATHEHALDAIVRGAVPS